jgi:hypothetical protein
LVFGCAYERMADASCSQSTLRRRREEWIELAYDRLIGQLQADEAVDGCLTKAPCGGEKAGCATAERDGHPDDHESY